MQTTAQRKWLATIHVAKKQTGIDDDAYRAILAGSAGVVSASEIKTWTQYDAVMRAFKRLGFSIRGGKGKSVEPQAGRNPEWISARQEYYIRGLWMLASRRKDEQSLRAMVRRISGSDDISFLRRKDATKVILALRSVTEDAGYDPDHAETQEGKKCY